jgi:predicted nuclease of predicted toxin-antitoxin system
MLLIDENLSYKLVSRLNITFPGIKSVVNTDSLGEGSDDNLVWQYAKSNNLVVVTKDKDFVDYWKNYGPPPKVIKLNIGNCRLNKVELFLKENKKYILEFIASNDALLILNNQ